MQSTLTDHSSFIKQLENALDGKLPGESAHYKMAPLTRKIRAKSFAKDKYPKISAVLILLYPHLEHLYTVLIHRNAYEGAHSAQVSFPGGKRDEQDSSLEQTALREAKEEIGVNPKDVQIIGRLSQLYIPPSGFLVDPFVGFVDNRPEFIPDPKEVQQIIEVPLNDIMDESNIKSKKINISSANVTIDAPYFDIQGFTVWGATSMILFELKMIVEKNSLVVP